MLKNYDIVIVGGGPTGSIASLLLAEKGLKIALIERNSQPYLIKNIGHRHYRSVFKLLVLNLVLINF